MGQIALVFHVRHSDFAERLAQECEVRGHTVVTGPSRLGQRDQYRSINHFTKVTNRLNVIAMDVRLYQTHREYVYQFCEALASGQKNIQIISMDDDWPTIQDDQLAPLLAISYLSARSPDGDLAPEDLVRKLLEASESRDVISHFTKERLECLLRGSYDPIALVHDVNEQEGRIAYSVFKCTHRISEQEDCFIALYPTAAAQPSLDHLKHFFPPVMAGQSTRHIVRSIPGQDMSARQRESLEALFQGRALRFESLVTGRKLRSRQPERLTVKGELEVPQRWKHATSEGNEIELSSERVRTESMFDGGFAAQRRITILNGAGGAGKTHFARFLHDRLLASTNEVFFLSAVSVSDANDVVIGSLYDIYRHCLTRDGERSVIDQEVFDLKFLVNSPVIIVDGLEEIITMLGDRFKLDSFYDDCISKAGEGANGRIIITTREQKWPAELNDYVSCYTLQLFDREQAVAFLDQSFPEDAERLALAKKVLDQIISGGEVSPLFCKIVVSELQGADSLDDMRKRLERGEYRAASGLAGFLNTIISREKKLGPTWPPEETKTALGKLASESAGGAVSFPIAKEILREAFVHHRDGDVNIDDAIRHFTLLNYNADTNSVAFRYDFLRTVFLAQNIIGRIVGLDLGVLKDRGTLVTLARHLVPGSDVQASIQSAVAPANRDEFLDALDIWVQALARGEVRTENERQTRQICSNLFFLRLAMDKTLRDKRDFTKVVKKLFTDPQDPNTIKKLSVVLFGQDESAAIKFDFSGIVVRSAWFIGSPIDEMIECDEATLFASSDFENCLGKHPGRSAGLWKARFDQSCRKDEPFSKVLAEQTLKGELTFEDKAAELRRFLAKFSPNGHSFTLRRSRDALQGLMRTVPVDRYIQVLREHALLEDADGGRGETLVSLTSKGRRAAHQYLRDAILGEFKMVLRDV